MIHSGSGRLFRIGVVVLVAQSIDNELVTQR
jgi:hypothetical protein